MLIIVLSVLHFTVSDYPLPTILTGEGQIVHITGGDDNRFNNYKADVVAGNYLRMSGVNNNDMAEVKMDDFWDVVEDSVAKKNNNKDKKFKYVFRANIILFSDVIT